MAARARTSRATPTPMPADAPLERPLELEDVEAIAVDEVEDVGVAEVEDGLCVCEEEFVSVAPEVAEVEVALALCVVEVATMPVEKAGSSIGIIDWNAHFMPCSLVSSVNATALVELRNRW